MEAILPGDAQEPAPPTLMGGASWVQLQAPVCGGGEGGCSVMPDGSQTPGGQRLHKHSVSDRISSSIVVSAAGGRIPICASLVARRCVASDGSWCERANMALETDEAAAKVCGRGRRLYSSRRTHSAGAGPPWLAADALVFAIYARCSLPWLPSRLSLP